jgi:hypothetical protein
MSNKRVVGSDKAVDASGNIYVAGMDDDLVTSPDEGITFHPPWAMAEHYAVSSSPGRG